MTASGSRNAPHSTPAPTANPRRDGLRSSGNPPGPALAAAKANDKGKVVASYGLAKFTRPILQAAALAKVAEWLPTVNANPDAFAAVPSLEREGLDLTTVSLSILLVALVTLFFKYLAWRTRGHPKTQLWVKGLAVPAFAYTLALLDSPSNPIQWGWKLLLDLHLATPLTVGGIALTLFIAYLWKAADQRLFQRAIAL